MMRTNLMRLSSVVVLALAGACGGGNGNGGGVDAQISTADAAGGQPDGAPVSDCSATGDYKESADATNDPFASTPMAENSLQTVSASGFTIGGCIDPLQANQNEMVSDADYYSFTVGGTGSTMVRVELTSTGAADLSQFTVFLLGEDQNGLFSIISDVWTSGVGGAFGATMVPPGKYYVAVLAGLPAPTAAVPYSIKVSEYAKPCAPTATDYTEAEAGTARSNDMVEIAYGQTGVTYTPTASTTDAVENSGLTLDVSGAKRIAAVSADVAVAGDYYDADTYDITTGANVTELYIGTNWDSASKADMDWFLFPTGTLDKPVGSSNAVDTAGEVSAIPVTPNTTYTLWVGTYKDAGITLPTNYTVDMCGSVAFPSN